MKNKVEEMMNKVNNTGLANEVINFYVNAYEPAMKRKTVKEADLIAIDLMKEMIANLDKAMNEKKKA